MGDRFHDRVVALVAGGSQGPRHPADEKAVRDGMHVCVRGPYSVN